MRLLFVVQRYGPEVAGGAEHVCRLLAERLAGRGHDVEVLTSCATNYVDWANVLPVGTERRDGVLVHRLPVDRPRDQAVFAPLNTTTVWGPRPVSPELQRAWMDEQGPHLPELPGWLAERAGQYAVIGFFTYLYWSTWAGLPVAARSVPTVLHPSAHDEPTLSLPLFEPTFRHPDSLVFWSQEEAELVRQRFGASVRSSVVGIGVDLATPADAGAFRRRVSGLDDRPYLLYLGRIDRSKGAVELFHQFVAYKERRPGPLALVMAGFPAEPLPSHADVFAPGFLTEEAKHGALAGCVGFVNPSYFESFSMVLLEAWAHGRPALVQRDSAVLAGHARRSGGGIPYRGFAELEASIDVLVDDPGVAAALGDAGRRYVEERYGWDTVLDRYEELLEWTAAHGRRSAVTPPSGT